jgi:hypothetical protein
MPSALASQTTTLSPLASYFAFPPAADSIGLSLLAAALAGPMAS